jgi:energy-coupling factor transporter ATP-binding protein EcfA2
MTTNPFPGLRPFNEDEDQFFFGRDGQSDEILARLRTNRFVAVVGTSGSGKSSLIKAGLLPSLHGGFMVTAGSGWRVALFRPGNNPIHNLAEALSRPGVLSDDAAARQTDPLIETTLRRSGLGLTEAVRQARMPAHENLLIVVDQFEELFRFRNKMSAGASEEDAAAFMKLLLEATQQREAPIYVVITMRSDFIGDCARFRELPETINQGLYLIPLMTRDQRRAAVTGPVAVAGAKVSPLLVNHLLNDVGGDPEQLPILQHALMRTWAYWDSNRKNGEPIDLCHYEAIGGMTEALSQHADEAYNELPDERARDIAEKLFRCLTEKGVDNRQVRRPTTVREICAIADASQEEVIAVIENFRQPGRSFLMPPSGVPLSAESLIDISHESLIGGWQRLKDWVDRESVSAGIYRRLAETSVLYPEKAHLLQDPELEVALAWRRAVNPNKTWADRYHPEYDRAMRFLDDSKDFRDADSIEREKQHRRERRLRLVFASSLIVAVIMLLAGGYSYSQKQTAEQRRREAEQATAAARKDRELAKQRQQEAEKATAQAVTDREAAERSRIEAQKQKASAEEQKREADAQRLIANRERNDADRQRAMVGKYGNWIAERIESVGKGVQLARGNLRERNRIIAELADQLIQVSPPRERARLRVVKENALTMMGEHEEALQEATLVLEASPNNLGALLARSNEYLILGKDSENAKKSVADVDRLLKSVDDMQVTPGESASRLESIAFLNKSISLGMLHEHDAAMKALGGAIQKFVFDGSGSFDSEVSEEIQNVTGQSVIVADGPTFKTGLYYQRANLLAFAGCSEKEFIEALKQADAEAGKYGRPVNAYLKVLNWNWHQWKVQSEDHNKSDYGGLLALGALWERASARRGPLLLKAKQYYDEFLKEHRRRRDPRYNSLAHWAESQIAELKKNQSLAQWTEIATLGANFPTLSRVASSLVTAGTTSRLTPVAVTERPSLTGNDPSAESLNEAIKSEPENLDLLIKRMRFHYYNMQDYDGARKDCKEILTLAPKTPLAYLYLAYLSSDEKEKVQYFRKVLQYDPTYSYALRYLSEILERRGKEEKEEALVYVRRLLTSNSDDTALLLREGKLVRDIKKTKEGLLEALKSINTAIAIKGDDLKFYNERKEIESALDIDKTDVVRHQALGYREAGDIMYRLGRADEAVRTYQLGLKILSDFLEMESANLGDKDKAALDSDLVSMRFKLSTLTKAQTSKQDSKSLMKMFPLVFFPRFDTLGVWDFKMQRTAQSQ